MRLRRKVLVGIGAALTLLLLFLVLLPPLINLDRYRGAIAARVGKALGRKVSLGDLKLSLLRPGALVRGIRIAEGPGFGEGPFLEAETLEVKVEPLPLLFGQLKVTKAILDRPRIVITHEGARGWNIDDLLRSRTDPGPRTPDLRSKAPVVDGRRSMVDGFLAALSLKELEVRRGELIFIVVEAERASTSQIANFNVKASQSSLEAPITFRSRAVLGEKAGIIELDGKVDPKLVLSGVEGAEGLPLEAVLKVQDLRAQFFKSYLDLTGSALDIAGSLDLELKVQGPWDQVGLEGDVDLDRLKIGYAGVFQKGEGEVGKLKVKGRWEQEGLTLEGNIQVADLCLSGLTFKNVASDVLYSQAVFHLHHLTASLGGGRFWADMEIDLSGRHPSLLVSSRLGGVRMGPLLKAFKEVPWSLDGMLSLRSTMTFQGVASWGLGTASGRGSLTIDQGRLKGHESFERFVDAFAPLLRSEGGRNRLDEFDRLQGEFTLEKGFVRTRDLTMSKGELKLLATGAVGLLDSSLNFDLVVQLPRALLEATLSGTTAEPLVALKGGRLQKRVEMELSKRKELKDLLKELFQ